MSKDLFVPYEKWLDFEKKVGFQISFAFHLIFPFVNIDWDSHFVRLDNLKGLKISFAVCSVLTVTILVLKNYVFASLVDYKLDCSKNPHIFDSLLNISFTEQGNRFFFEEICLKAFENNSFFISPSH